MSIQSNNAQIDQVLLPSVRDLGDFQVRRALPSAHRRMVGPFIFLDSFGPAVFREGAGWIRALIRISASPRSPI